MASGTPPHRSLARCHVPATPPIRLARSPRPFVELPAYRPHVHPTRHRPERSAGPGPQGIGAPRTCEIPDNRCAVSGMTAAGGRGLVRREPETSPAHRHPGRSEAKSRDLRMNPRASTAHHAPVGAASAAKPLPKPDQRKRVDSRPHFNSPRICRISTTHPPRRHPKTTSLQKNNGRCIALTCLASVAKPPREANPEKIRKT